MTKFHASTAGFTLASVLVIAVYGVVMPDYKRAQEVYWTKKCRNGELDRR